MVIIKRIGTILIAIGLLGLLTGMGYLIYSGITLGFNSIPTPAEAEYLTLNKTISFITALIGIAFWAVGLYSQTEAKSNFLAEVFW